MARRPTVYDVAQRAGVSIATVSFAFSQPHRVKPTTLDTVLQAAGELGYLPSASARGLARGRTGAIGLYSFDYLIDEEPDPDPGGQPQAEPDYRSFPLYVDEVRSGVELECRRLGYALMVGGGKTGPATPSIIDIAGRVDGLIAFAGSLPSEDLARVSSRIAVVALGSSATGPRLRTVAVDNFTGMRRLTEHLLHHHGFRRLVYFGGRQTPEFADRYNGFAAALAAAGVTAPTPIVTVPDDDLGTARAVRAHLELDLTAQALVCSTDQEALAVMDTLRTEGLAVPERFAVTGFDGIVAGRLSHPTLTTVRQPMVQIGRAAVRALVDLLEGGNAPARVPPLPVELIVRGSCGCAPGLSPDRPGDGNPGSDR